MELIDEKSFSQFLREACRQALQVPGSEICGLLVDTGHQLILVRVRNILRRAGCFMLSPRDVRRVVAAATVLGQEVVGTFHSHPLGLAIPGESDIGNAVDDSLMLIFDCTGKEGRLWKIKDGQARARVFALSGKKARNI